MALAAEISTRTVCAGETPAKTRSAAKKVIGQRNSSLMEFSQKGYCYDLIARKQLQGSDGACKRKNAAAEMAVAMGIAMDTVWERQAEEALGRFRVGGNPVRVDCQAR